MNAPLPKADRISGGVAAAEPHDSAAKHVTGKAVYIDDMPEPAGTLHGCLGLSAVAHGTIASIDLSAVRAAPGVVDVLTASDIPGENDISPTGRHDEPVLADDRVVGFVTSGGYGHTVGASLALAYVEPAFATADAGLGVAILGDTRPARLAPAPLYDPSGARMRS